MLYRPERSKQQTRRLPTASMSQVLAMRSNRARTCAGHGAIREAAHDSRAPLMTRFAATRADMSCHLRRSGFSRDGLSWESPSRLKPPLR
ncbi:hypothetical protein ACP93_19770 [Xanthomonas sp. NCPPB 1128]|nr:hypothetical protein ACP93_19770 [Xanthomonas sp. NCPPB 1128]